MCTFLTFHNWLKIAQVAIAVRSKEETDYQKTASYLRYCHVIELLEIKTLSMRQFFAGAGEAWHFHMADVFMWRSVL